MPAMLTNSPWLHRHGVLSAPGLVYLLTTIWPYTTLLGTALFPPVLELPKRDWCFSLKANSLCSCFISLLTDWTIAGKTSFLTLPVPIKMSGSWPALTTQSTFFRFLCCTLYDVRQCVHCCLLCAHPEDCDGNWIPKRAPHGLQYLCLPRLCCAHLLCTNLCFSILAPLW